MFIKLPVICTQAKSLEREKLKLPKLYDELQNSARVCSYWGIIWAYLGGHSVSFMQVWVYKLVHMSHGSELQKEIFLTFLKLLELRFCGNKNM